MRTTIASIIVLGALFVAAHKTEVTVRSATD